LILFFQDITGIFDLRFIEKDYSSNTSILIKCHDNYIIIVTEVYNMASNITEEITNRIQKAEEGTIFLTGDFADITSITTARKSLGRLVQRGVIRRVMDGVYEKPRFSTFLKEQLPTDPDAVANALARYYHWNIAPAGDLALNKLGLSTQVPTVWSYISDGPYREFSWDNVRLSFKHRTNRDISNMSDHTVMVIEALKTLGKDRVDDEIVKILKEKIPEKEKNILKEEAFSSAEWLSEVIRKVCN
jgi:hypothetical protein